MRLASLRKRLFGRLRRDQLQRERRRRQFQQTTRRLESLEERALMAVIAVGNEFLASTPVAGSPHVSSDDAAVAMKENGDFYVAYESAPLLGGGNIFANKRDIFVQHYLANGTPVNGAPFQVNTYSTADQRDAAIAVGANQDWVAVWSGQGLGEFDGVFARRFGPDGATPQISVNVPAAGQQGSAAVAVADDGSFVVAWASRGIGDVHSIFVRRFNAQGVAQTGEVLVNTTTGRELEGPSIAMVESGEFVVTWSSHEQDGDGWGVFSQRFSAAAAKAGNELRVNTETDHDQRQAQVGMADNGNFVVTWASQLQDDGGLGVFGQRFLANGTAAGGEFQVNTSEAGDQTEPHIAVQASGQFVVSWTGPEAAAGGPGIFAQTFLADGTRDGAQFGVNTTIPGAQHSSAVAVDSVGNLAIVWTGPVNALQQKVFARRFMPDRDTTPPTVTVALTNDTGISNTDRITRDPAINGAVTDTSEIARLLVGLDAGALAEAEIPADFSGPYSFTRAQLEDILNTTIADGQHTLRVQAFDEEGNPSAIAELTFTLDTAGNSPVPTAMDLIAVDSGDPTDNLTNDTTPTVQVTATAGVVVRLLEGTTVLGTATAGANGIAEITTTALAQGAHALTATSGDAAGNDSAPSAVLLTITIDTTAPTTPTLMLEPDDDTPPVGNNFTSNGLVDLIGTTSPNTFVNLVGRPNTAVSDANGNFRFNGVTLADASANAFVVRATDAADNQSLFNHTIFRGNEPLLINPESNITVSEDSPAQNIALGDNFVGEGVTLTVLGNTNLNLLSTTLNGTNLALVFFADRNGTADITVRATDINGQFEDDVFTVTVTPLNDAPQVITERLLQDVTVTAGAIDRVINIGGLFGDVDNAGTLVRFETTLGTIGIELFDGATPVTVANFLKYVNDTTTSGGDYDGTFFHRNNPGFVIQGGSFRVGGAGFPNAEQIPTDAPIVNEFRISNTVGTLSMAKTGGGPNTATSGFFFSVADNSGNLDNQNGGFTVFARVLPSTMAVVDAIEDATIIDLQPNVPNVPFDPFGQVPMQNYTQAQANAQVPLTNDVVMQLINAVVDPSLTGARGSDQDLTFLVTNPNPGVVNATLNGNQLMLDFASNVTQSTTVTISVRATDGNQAFTVDTFTVTVNPPPASPLVLETPDGSAGNTLLPSAEELAASNPRALSPEMERVVQQAAALWAAAGLDAAGIEQLAGTKFRLADLPGNYLGLAIDDEVWLDSDAGGLGWFVDSTPGDDLEFAADLAGELRALSGGPAAGQVDLLTVAAHELGHMLGLGHLDAHDHDGGLMSDSLASGVRRLPSAAADSVFNCY